jgi:hypothetical protein
MLLFMAFMFTGMFGGGMGINDVGFFFFRFVALLKDFKRYKHFIQVITGQTTRKIVEGKRVIDHAQSFHKKLTCLGSKTDS